MPIFDFQLDTLVINHIYAHEVPLKTKGVPLELSTAECSVNNNTRDRIEGNLRSSLSRQELRLTFNPELSINVMHIVEDYLKGEQSSLLLTSRKFAEELYDKQPGNSSPGMILVASAECNGKPAITLMKLDKGLSVSHQKIMVDGGTTYDLSEISTLSVDKKSIFKAALFVSSTDDNGTYFTEIMASDHQVSDTDSRDIADFFLKKFLGCDYHEPPSSVFRRVFENLQQGISEAEVSSAEKLQMMSALDAMVNDLNSSLNVDDFINSVFPDKEKQQVEQKLITAGLSLQEVQKDTSAVETKKYLACTLSSGIRVIGLTDDVLNMIVDEGEGKHIRIEGMIVDYKSRKTQ